MLIIYHKSKFLLILCNASLFLKKGVKLGVHHHATFPSVPINIPVICPGKRKSILINLTQKVRKVVFGRWFICCNNAIWQYILYRWKACFLTFQMVPHLWGKSICGAAEPSMWGAPRKNVTNLLCQCHSFFLLTLIWCCGLDDWSLMKQDILATIYLLTMYSFNKQPQ